MVIAIIIFVVALIVALNIMVATNKVKTESEHAITSTGNNPDWALRHIVTGMKVLINGVEKEIVNVCLISDKMTTGVVSYEAKFTLVVYGSQNTDHDIQGRIYDTDVFQVNGKVYHGKVLAGGPDAKVKNVELVVK